MDYVKGMSRNQLQIMRSLDDCVEENNVVRIIDAFVDSLDIEGLNFSNNTLNKEGRPPYSPKDMLKLYIYGLENGITSSRKLERECGRNIELMWLINEIRPENKTICNFRKDNSKALTEMFREFCRMLKSWDLIGGHVMALDGTKIRANNSRKNNFSISKIDRSIKYIDEKIAKYMAEIETNDKEESSVLQLNKTEVQAKIAELKERKTKYSSYKQIIESGDGKEVSAIDSDSRLMSAANNGVEVCFNVQSMVDSKHKLVAGMSVINNAADVGQMSVVSADTKENLKLVSDEDNKIVILADKGYYSAQDIYECEQQGLTTIVAKPDEPKEQDEKHFKKSDFLYDEESDVFICPAGKKLCASKPDKKGYKRYRNSKACSHCPLLKSCTTGKRKDLGRHIHASSAERNNKRLSENQKLYKQRQMLVEHPFGTIKRTMGIRQFSTRGLIKVTAEAALIFTVYNLKRLVRILGVSPLIAKMQGKS